MNIALLLILAVIMPVITAIILMFVLTIGGGHSEDEGKSPYDIYYSSMSSMWGKGR